MLLFLARFFVYASVFAPLMVRRDLFFPFISAKAIFFRVAIELALACLVLHVTLSANRKEIFKELWHRLKQPLVLALAIFTLLFVITALTALSPQQAFWSNFERGEGAFQILHYFSFFLLCVLLFGEKKRFERLLKVNILVGFLMSVYALVQYLGAQDKFGVIGGGGRISGTLGNPSYLAAYLLFIFAFLIYFFPRVKNNIKKLLVWIALFAFELFIFLNTGTRGAYLALLVGVGLLVLINLFQTKNRQVRLWLFALLAAGVAFLVLFVATSNSPFWEKIPGVNRALDMSVVVREFQPRLWTWGSAIAGVLDRPILGWGAENFAFAFDKYYNPNHFGIESFFDRTHNVLLEYLITGGLLLFIAYAAIFFCYYRLLVGREKNFWYSLLLVMPIAYLIQGFFLFDVLPIYLVLYLWYAFTLNTVRPDPLPALNRDSYQLSGVGLATIFIATVGAVTLIYFTALNPLAKNQALARALQSENGDQAVKNYESAYAISSPVGQEETFSSFNKFAIGAIDNTFGNPEQRTKIPLEAYRALVDKVNKWYDDNTNLIVGAKDIYLNGGLNLNVGEILKQKDYIDRGKKIYNDELKYAPTRIELLKILLETAKMEHDDTTYKTLVARIKLLRPDLRWE